MKFGIGQPVGRLEDRRFVTGRGRFLDDLRIDGALHLAVVRSPVAHARIRSVDVTAAEAVEGVVAVVTAERMDPEGRMHIPCLVPLKNRDGSRRADPPRPVLARDRVRHAGEAVAFVVAESRAAAEAAAEAVAVDWEELPAVVDPARADAAAVTLHEAAPRNVAFDWHFGDEAAVAEAFARAAHVTRLELVNNRVVPCAMEPRACLAHPEEGTGRLVVWVPSQGVWLHRQLLARLLGLPEARIRVRTPDVGGGFGMKIFVYPEYVMVAWAAHTLGRPVRWTAGRGESFLADTHGRGHVTVAELAFDADARMLAYRVRVRADMGAYLSNYAPFIPTLAALKVLTGVYRIPAVSYGVLGVFTNTQPVDAYRGAGRPESIYALERLVDVAARELGLPPEELRRRNMIAPEEMPYRTAAGETYDSGEFVRLMEACMTRADWAGAAARREEARRRGRLRGIGMAYYIEATMGDAEERARVRFLEDGTVEVAVGTQSTGQGHETAYAQILAERLGVPPERVRVVQGDTDVMEEGGGTGGSRSLTAEGTALLEAAARVIEKGRLAAAHHFEAAVDDVVFADGVFRVRGTDREIALLELARLVASWRERPAGLESGLDADAEITLSAYSYPNGCHIAEVEVDPETGTVDLVRYTVVDDFGVVLNPLLVAGQVHGGIAQGVGQALLEHAVFDPDSGQLLTGSFADYALPRADRLPFVDFSYIEIPCRHNPLGVKGCGEAGSIGAPPAVVNAVMDALAPLGIRHLDMPLTPARVRAAVAAAGG